MGDPHRPPPLKAHFRKNLSWIALILSIASELSSSNCDRKSVPSRRHVSGRLTGELTPL